LWHEADDRECLLTGPLLGWSGRHLLNVSSSGFGPISEARGLNLL
jgi:hypothetical protein